MKIKGKYRGVKKDFAVLNIMVLMLIEYKKENGDHLPRLGNMLMTHSDLILVNMLYYIYSKIKGCIN